MAFLDDRVLTALKENMFTPERLTELLSAIAARRQERMLPSASIDPEKVAEFSKLMSDLLDNGETLARKAYLRTLIGAIIVGDKSMTIGPASP
jgi:site-specific DNA recombinase